MYDRVLNMPLDYLNCSDVVLRNAWKNLIYAKLIIVFTANSEFSPYSEVIDGSTTIKLTKT